MLHSRGSERIGAYFGPVMAVWFAVLASAGCCPSPAVPAALEAHQAEFPVNIAETSFFLGRETPVGTVRPELPVWREKLYAFLGRNAVSASDHVQIPTKRVIDQGTQVEL